MAESDNILTKLQDVLLYLIPQLNKFPRDCFMKNHLRTSGLMMAGLLLALPTLHAQTDYTNKWSTVDGGGRSSTGGVYTITGTAAQPDAGVMRGGDYTVNGGFWGRIAVVQMPGAPLLSIRRTGVNTLAICWPYPSTGYGLQLSTNLNMVNWVAAANVPVHVSDEWQVTVSPPTEGPLDENYCEYFQLKKAGP